MPGSGCARGAQATANRSSAPTERTPRAALVVVAKEEVDEVTAVIPLARARDAARGAVGRVAVADVEPQHEARHDGGAEAEARRAEHARRVAMIVPRLAE